MAFFEWSPEYSVQVSELDDQHKKLLMMMNKAYDAIQENVDHINVSTLLTAMSDYAIMHFSKEEHLLKKYEYNEFETQQKEHNQFFDQIMIFKTKLSDGDPFVMAEIAEYLSKWLFSHIKIHDKKYSFLLNENGLV